MAVKTLDRRIQLLLDEVRYQKIAREAAQRGVSVAGVIREAIDQFQTEEELERRRQAIREILAAEPMPVPDDPADLKREIEEMHNRRFPDWS